jgi:putative aldouronate transport system substrate-binding protein
MKKTLIVLFSIMILVGALSANGAKEAEASTGPVNLTWLTGVWTNEVDSKGYLKAAALELLNVDLTLNVMPAAQLGQKAQVMITGGDYPEILTLHYGPNSTYKQWADQGVFVGLDKYWNDYPGLVEGFPEEETLKTCRVNGELYMIPILMSSARFNFSLRQDWLDNLGMEVPTTIDEYYQVAKAFREGDPDGDGKKNTYAFGMDKLGGSGPEFILPAFGIEGTFREYYLDDSGKIVPNILHPNAKEALAFLQKCFQEELLYPDSIAQIYGQSRSDFKGGKTGSFLELNESSAEIDSIIQVTDPNAKVVRAEPLHDSEGNQTWFLYSPVWRGNVITQKADSEEKIRGALSLMDWMVGDGSEMRMFGPEGAYWTNRTSSGNPILEGEKLEQFNADGYKSYNVMIRPNKTEAFILAENWGNPSEFNMIKDAFKMYEAYGVYSPATGITTPTMIEMGATLEQIILAGTFDIIAGGKPVSYLDSVIKEWSSKGGTKMLQEMNAEYKK